MEGNPPSIPRVLSQPLSVDFIEKELPQFHEAFKSSQFQYDSALKRFVATPQVSAMLTAHAQNNALAVGRPQPMPPIQHASAALTHKARSIPTRQRPPPLQAMTFWNKIIDKAIDEFKAANSKAPEEIVAKPEYDIRSLRNWHDIYDKLLKAMEAFNGTNSQASHGIKKAYRRVIDKHDVARRVVDCIPDIEYISPIKAAVKLILDAAETTSTVRQAVGLAFDEKDLEKTFGNIEVFLTIFPGDENIESASIDLIACTLKAVEGAIAYYLSRTFIRAVEGVSKDFKKGLLDNIGEISAKCETLRDTALVSHIDSNRKGMELILEGVQGIEELKLAMSEQSGQIMSMLNLLLHLFLSGERKREQEAENFRKKQEEQSKQYEEKEVLFVERPLIASPPMQTPQWHIQPPQHNDYHHQILQQPSVPPQGIPSFPPYGGQLPAYYYAVQPPQQPTVHVNTLLEILGVSGLDRNDIASILDFEESILLGHRGQAKSIMLTDEFHAWATSSRSCELLVQGNPGRDAVEAGRALSLVSATLIQALRSQDRFIPLVFFCQQHTEPDDPFSGPNILLRSLITQLLQQYFANSTFWEHNIDLNSLRSVDVGVLHLKSFFEWLVRQIPQGKTLVCVLDGVEAYETREDEDDLRVVMDSLLGLARDPGLLPVIKVMATSHTGTVSLEECFNRSDSSILEMEGLSPCGDEDAMMEVGDALRP